jgi:hypothetical protein
MDVTPGSEADEARNRQSAFRVGLMIAMSFLLATTAPQPLVMAAFSSMALISAFVILGFAMVMGERMWTSHFTRWDEAAVMLGVSLLAGLFVDPAAIQKAMEAQSGALPTAPTDLGG